MLAISLAAQALKRTLKKFETRDKVVSVARKRLAEFSKKWGYLPAWVHSAICNVWDPADVDGSDLDGWQAEAEAGHAAICIVWGSAEAEAVDPDGFQS